MYYTKVVPNWLNVVAYNDFFWVNWLNIGKKFVVLNKWLCERFYFGVLGTICRPSNLMSEKKSAEKLAYN